MQNQQSPQMMPLQSQQQKLVLNHQMRLSLKVLRMPIWELREYLAQEINENPVLEPDGGFADEADERFAALTLEKPAAEALHPEEEALTGTDTRVSMRGDDMPGWESFSGEGSLDPGQLHRNKGQGFRESLLEQLAVMSLAEDFEPLCAYVVECLDRRGYLDVPLEDIAGETGRELFEVTQALYAVQSLLPTGVGARDLQECLILQLVEGPDFCANTITLVKCGLELLARRDTKAIAKLLGCGEAETMDAVRAVLALNPIPSRGYDTGEDIVHVIPDALVEKDGEGYSIILNRSILPKVSIDAEGLARMAEAVDKQTKQYLRERQQSARMLAGAVEERYTTLHRLLAAIVKRQPQFFADGKSLQPMTLADMAEELGVHVSTVSRTVQDKAIVCAAGTVPLKSLFSGGIRSRHSGDVISAAVIREKLRKCIESEDKARPLSDEDLKHALEAMGISASRRAIAKYREGMGIPASSRRRSVY